MSALLVTTMLILSIPQSLLSMSTFKRESMRETGCGIYLFTNAIVALMTITFLNLKFWLLVLAQTGIIVERSFLAFNCVSIDYLLQIFLNTNNWQNACVAGERAFIVSKGIRFDKIKSRQMAKWIILAIILVTFTTNVHDPIHRHLFDIKEEQRTWYLVTYNAFYRILNLIMHFLFIFLHHFRLI